MKTIEIIETFRHRDQGEAKARVYEPGVQEVSDRCAEVALETGYAREPGNAPAGSETGEGETSSSSRPAPAPAPKPKAAGSKGSAKPGKKAKAK